MVEQSYNVASGYHFIAYILPTSQVYTSHITQTTDIFYVDMGNDKKKYYNVASWYNL